MSQAVTTGTLSETEFAALVDALAADPNRCAQLTDLLLEDHPFYHQRGAATIARMRGWVLLALARIGVSDSALLFVLEELDNGIDPYLVAAAAYALRSYKNPGPELAPYVIHALTQIRYRDDPVSFDGYGEYAVSGSHTSPVRELLKTLAWLGPHARDVLPEIEALRAQRGGRLSKKLLAEVDLTLKAISDGGQRREVDDSDCCALPDSLSKFSWLRSRRCSATSIESLTFEDQDEGSITFKDFFWGHPSIVVFFYTRCDNPLKCSLTVTKLARIQERLREQGLADQINTAAITYDPEFDIPKRIRVYGRDRGVRTDMRNRMLRATEGINALREHFKLGVNFIESLVNRHRIEAYILDAQGRIAGSFERLRWDEREVVDRAIEVLAERDSEAAAVVQPRPAPLTKSHNVITPLGAAAALGVAFFPKCPICWAAYLSMFGIAGLNQIPYSPWLQPILIAVMLINLASVWLRAWLTGRMISAYLVSTGAAVILVSRIWPGWEKAAVVGVVLTLAGSLLSTLGSIRNRRLFGGLFSQT